MNAIKGLILKDLAQLKSYKKTLITFIIILFVYSVTQENLESLVNMIVVILTLGFGMFAVGSFSYDEYAKSDRYMLTLPVTKRDVVFAKYLLVISSSLIGATLGMTLGFIIMLFNNSIDGGLLFSIASGSFFGISLIECLQIPCIYKWGVEKGRIQIFIISFVLIGLGALLMTLPIDFAKIFNFKNTDLLIKMLPFILLILSLVFYYISYKVSINIYNKKEL